MPCRKSGRERWGIGISWLNYDCPGAITSQRFDEPIGIVFLDPEVSGNNFSRLALRQQAVDEGLDRDVGVSLDPQWKRQREYWCPKLIAIESVLGVLEPQPSPMTRNYRDLDSIKPDNELIGQLPVCLFQGHTDAELPEHTQESRQLLSFVSLFQIRQVGAMDTHSLCQLCL